MLVFKRTEREHLRSVTPIVSAHRVKLSDDPSALVASVITQFRADCRAAIMRSGRIKRAGKDAHATRWFLVFEFDLVHPRLITPGKKELLRQLDVHEVLTDEQVLIVHAHGVIDCQGHRSPSMLMDDLRDAFPGPRRIHARRFHENQTVAESLECIAGYSAKHIRAYSSAYDDPSQPTKFGTNFDDAWAAWMDQLYGNITLDNLVFSSVVSRANGEPECPPQHAKTLTPQGFSQDEQADQLEIVKEAHSETNDNAHPVLNTLQTLMASIMTRAAERRQRPADRISRLE